MEYKKLMNLKYRTNREIKKDILKEIYISYEIKVTPLTQKSNLTYERLQEYLDEFRNEEYIKGISKISLTPKGMNFLIDLLIELKELKVILNDSYNKDLDRDFSSHPNPLSIRNSELK